MKMSRLERYKNGERTEVWKELIALGASLDADAHSVIDEVARRVRDNIFKLKDSANDLGYRFLRAQGPFVLRTEATLAQIGRAEQEWGRFPRLVRRLYEVFEYIDFSQDEKQSDEQYEAGPLRGMGNYPQLLMLSLEEAADLRKDHDEACDESDNLLTEVMRKRGEEYILPDRESYLLLGPCASNNSMKGFTLPCHSVDAVYFNDGGGDTFYYDDLRHIFRSGGFPQVMLYAHHDGMRRTFGMQDPQRILDYLTRNLEPL